MTRSDGELLAMPSMTHRKVRAAETRLLMSMTRLETLSQADTLNGGDGEGVLAFSV